MRSRHLPIISAEDARTLLLGGQGLLDDPSRRTTPGTVERVIRALGFVQIDSINTVERAHHLILASRLDGYAPCMLHRLLEKKRTLFEHWTHDASAIPTEFFPHWRHRFERHAQRARSSKWWRERLGRAPDKVIAHVRTRVEREGPLMSRDFEDDRIGLRASEKAWWGWKPQKIALEHLWRTGELAIAKRMNFQKVYDLTPRVLPHVHHLDPPGFDAHVDWACSSAMERLGVASPSELAGFWRAIDVSACREWCAAAEREGRIVRARAASHDGAAPRETFAIHDWTKRLAKLPSAPRRMRLICPFDPVLRDRKRAMRLFGFEYRFEAFVPEAKRVHGYYVMPLLEGDRMVGRVDPKFDRTRGVLEIRKVWWEDGVRPTRMRRSALDEAVARLAGFVGAPRYEIRL